MIMMMIMVMMIMMTMMIMMMIRFVVRSVPRELDTELNASFLPDRRSPAMPRWTSSSSSLYWIWWGFLLWSSVNYDNHNRLHLCGCCCSRRPVGTPGWGCSLVHWWEDTIDVIICWWGWKKSCKCGQKIQNIWFQNKPTDGPLGGGRGTPRGMGMVLQDLTSDHNVKFCPRPSEPSYPTLLSLPLTTTLTIKSRYDKEVRDTLRDTLHLGNRYTHSCCGNRDLNHYIEG